MANVPIPEDGVLGALGFVVAALSGWIWKAEGRVRSTKERLAAHEELCGVRQGQMANGITAIIDKLDQQDLRSEEWRDQTKTALGQVVTDVAVLKAKAEKSS